MESAVGGRVSNSRSGAQGEGRTEGPIPAERDALDTFPVLSSGVQGWCQIKSGLVQMKNVQMKKGDNLPPFSM